jgi:hypothetical protein
MEPVTNKMEPCIEQCDICHGVCVETTIHCLKQGGEHSERDHIRHLMDCADACAMAADFMRRGSDYFGEVCTLCAAICDQCADDCEAMPNDPIMRHCAETCRRCADSCREMASLAV